MLPARLDLEVYQGDDWERILRFKQPDGTPEDLTGMTGKAQLRRKATDATPAAEFVVQVLPEPGTVRIALPKAVTSGLSNRYVWDLQLAEPTRTRLQGQVNVYQQVTR